MKFATRNKTHVLLFLSVLNLMIMHYTIFSSCNVERQIDFTVFIDNFCAVSFECLFLFFVLSIFFWGRTARSAFVCSILTLLWSFCNIVYARFFHQYISVSAIGEGGNLLDSIVLRSLIDGVKLADSYFIISAISSVIFYRFSEEKKMSLTNIQFGCVLILVLLVIDILGHTIYCLASPSKRYVGYIKHRVEIELFSQKCYTAQPIYSNFQRGSIRALGYAVIDNLSGKLELSDAQKEDLHDVLASLRSEQICIKNHTNIQNVIFILVESYMAFTVDMKIGDKEVTPFLNSLKRDSTVYFNGKMVPNITLGESSDGQFIYMTGLLPLRSEITVTKAKNYSYSALPRQLNKYKGISARMVIPTAASMWSQDIMCEKYGFDNLYSAGEYRKDHSIYLSDDQIFDFASSIDTISTQPFFSMILTFSMHQPYINKTDTTFHEYNNNYSSSLNNYLNACHFMDRQLCDYFKFLKENHLYECSLIVVASDHHVAENALDLPKGVFDRSLPLFIINSGLDLNKTWTGVCNQLDLYTTLLDILGVQAQWRGLGHSLFNSDYKNSLEDRKWDYSEWIIKSGLFDEQKN